VRKRSFVILLVVVAVVAAAFILLKFTRKAGAGDYKTASVQRGSISSTVTATGTLNPVTTVQVGSQISGTVAELHADFNSRVRRGELIALIDTTFLAASVREAEASVERAQAEAKQAGIDLERAKALQERQLNSKFDYESVFTKYEGALANLKSARAQFARAKVNLRYASIKAPVDGVVISRNVDVGQTVAASLSAPTLFLIAQDLRDMQLEADIDEADIGMIRVGQQVTFTVSTYPDDVFGGTVSQVRLEPIEVQDVVNYKIIVSVSNPEEKLMPGMTATLTINIETRDNVLKVPNMALRFKPPEEVLKAAMGGGKREAGGQERTAGREGATVGGQERTPGSRREGAAGRGGQGPGMAAMPGAFGSSGKTVWKLDKRGKLLPVPVQTGLTDGSFTEVISDRLQEGDKIVVGLASNNKSNGEQRGQTNPFMPQMHGPGRR
jgi:HlyD family secretion protein